MVWPWNGTHQMWKTVFTFWVYINWTLTPCSTISSSHFNYVQLPPSQIIYFILFLSWNAILCSLYNYIFPLYCLLYMRICVCVCKKWMVIISFRRIKKTELYSTVFFNVFGKHNSCTFVCCFLLIFILNFSYGTDFTCCVFLSFWK